MAMDPAAPGDHPEPAVDGPPDDARGLAELAFGSLTEITGVTHRRHLALLPVETLELNLADPAQRCFDDYELLALLGEGGMGVVYRARQISLDREVAIKLLSAGPWASKAFIARFEREARNAARMQHANIVTVYEVGSFEGLQFFSMRLVQGESLSTKLRRGERFSPKAAAVLLRTVAEAVDYAHNLGVLHLDLKPANVLLDADGVPYVADFGLARRLENALAVENDEVSGTPAYMAPEQAQVRAHKLTAATDIWGLGAILYELLTGAPPFRADSAQATVKLVLEGRVRAPRRARPSLPRDLEAIVLRCLARDPARRYPSARGLADDLARYVEGRPVQARPLNAAQRLARWARREPRLAATAACAVAVLIVGLVATAHQWHRAEVGAGAARDSLWSSRAQAAQQALASGDGFRSLQPLVDNLAEMEAAGHADEASIERQRIGTILANAPQLAGLVRLAAGQVAASVAIAPDGRHFAVATYSANGGAGRFVRQYDLATLRETWSTSTADRTFLTTYGDADGLQGGLHYSTNGRYLLTTGIEQPVMPAPGTSDMIAIDARDGKVLWPGALKAPHADVVYDDALRYALVRFRSDPSLRWPDAAQFHEVDGWKPVGPRHTVATTLPADFWLPMPDGSAWLGTRDTVAFALYDVPLLVPRWRLQLPQTSIVRAWRFSHDGRWLALGSADGTVRLVDAADGHAVQLASGPVERVVRVEFSADDRTLAAVDENGQVSSWDVATRDARSAPFRFQQGLTHAALIRFAGDTLFGAGNRGSRNTELAYATLTPHAPFNLEAVPGAVRLHGLTEHGVAFDVSARAHRLVTAAADGLLAIWRLPPLPLLEVQAAPLQPFVQRFDGRRLVAVDGDMVRVVDAESGAPRSPPLRHPGAVRFAELASDGHSLVTVAGRTVRVIDTRTWRLRGAPVVLPGTPEQAALAQSAPVLVATTAEYAGDGRRALIHRIDFANAPRLGDAIRVDAPQRFEIDARGRNALVATWNPKRPGAVMRVALEDGAVKCAPKTGPLWTGALAADGRSAWFAVASADGRPRLQHWDLDACRELPMAARPAVEYEAVLVPRGDGLLVHRGGKEALIRFDANGRRVAAVGDAIPGSMYDIALSADGQRSAIATRNAVHVLDARQGRRLSAPLAAPIGGDDAIATLAFSPDGTRLLARTINHRWLSWRLPSTGKDPGELARLARMLDPDPDAPLTADELDAVDASLRGVPAASGRGPDALPSPVMFAAAPGDDVDPRFVPLDLARALDVPLSGRTWPEPFARGDLPTLAPGTQRFLGVDYRVDGGVQLSAGGTALAIHPEHRHSGVVPVAGIHARRVYVLAFMHIPILGAMARRTFGYVVLIGADGRETRLEIRTIRDVITDVANPQHAASGARVAFRGIPSALVRLGYDPANLDSAVYAVALDVPANSGPIRGLRFDVGDGPMEAPLFLAATLERAEVDDGKAGGSGH